jgi:hypothetical protein
MILNENRIDNVERLLPAFDTLTDERQKDSILLVG